MTGNTKSSPASQPPFLEWLARVNTQVSQWAASMSWWRLILLFLLILIASLTIGEMLHLKHDRVRAAGEHKDVNEQGALDYLLKPVEAERLAQAAQRVRNRLARRADAAAGTPATDEAALDPLLAKFLQAQQSAQRPPGAGAEPPLRWIQCTTGSTTRLINVKDVLFFRSDEKYTRVQTRDQEAFIRTRFAAPDSRAARGWFRPLNRPPPPRSG